MKHLDEIVKAFGMTNMLLEEELNQVEQKFGLDLGRHDRSKSDDSTRRQFDMAVRAEAAAMAVHYETFYCLEKTIRSLITDVLEAAEGDAWWTSARIPSNIQTAVANRIARERESGVTRRSTDELDYTTFGELSEIIKASWALFGSVLNDMKAVETIMARLNTLRGPIAHCAPLAEDEVLRLELTLNDWFRLLK